MALITNRKTPILIIVSGIVNNTRIGFNKIFNNEITKAINIAVRKPGIVTPGTKYAARSKDKEVAKILMM